MKTKQEFSAGGVVYKKNEDQEPRFLLGKHSGYHKWVLPKGLIEEGETAEVAAVRETEEEMAVTAKIIQKEPLHIEKYSYIADYKNAFNLQPEAPGSTRRVAKYQEEGGGSTKVNKTVTFYLMEYVSGDPKSHGWEMEDAGWFSYSKALEMMSFEGEKKALTKAYQLLQT
jgi:8-oxo-dGTP diphosphatase